MKQILSYKNLRKKIVLLTMAFLILWEMILLSAIYGTTYIRVSSENQRRLMEFAQKYGVEGQEFEAPPQDKDKPIPFPKANDARTIYMVKFDAKGNVLSLMNDINQIMDDDTFAKESWNLVQSGKQQGSYENLIYRIVTDREESTYVVMMDNTILNDSTTELLRNTVFVGLVSLFVFFIIIRYLSYRIVSPMEKNDERQKQFISDAGHELKTPLAVIQTNLEMLERAQGESKWSKNIKYENQKMKDLVIELLDLSKAESAEYVLAQKNVSRIVMGELLPMESLAFEQGIFIESDVEEDIFGNVDAAKIKQLTSILLDNAISHTQKKESGRIYIALKQDKKYIRLTVKNEGSIPENERLHLFERFYKSDLSRSDDGHYGLGLAIAKAIMTGHKGTITVRSDDGFTTFICLFPIGRSNVKNE